MNNLTAQYATAVVGLGAELGLPAANIFDALMAVPDWQVSSRVHSMAGIPT
jgi:hypothetical protein